MNDEKKTTFALRIKEVNTEDFKITADTEDDAVEKLKAMYESGEVTVSVSGASGYVVILDENDVELEEITCF